MLAVHYCRRLDSDIDQEFVRQLGERHAVYDYNADDPRQRKTFYGGFELAQQWVSLPWVVICLRFDLSPGTHLDERRFGQGRAARRLAKLLLDGKLENWACDA